MAVDFKSSETMKNLMKAFAGESQARNRYTFAAGQAKNENLYVISAIFKFTAKQEKEHAEIFYQHLKEMAGEQIAIEGSYPVDITDSITKLLRYAEHNEMENTVTFTSIFPKLLQMRDLQKFPLILSRLQKLKKPTPTVFHILQIY